MDYFLQYPIVSSLNIIHFHAFTVLSYSESSISILYNTLLNSQTAASDALRNAWSVELGEDIGPAAWERALSWVHTSSICARHGVSPSSLV